MGDPAADLKHSAGTCDYGAGEYKYQWSERGAKGKRRGARRLPTGMKRASADGEQRGRMCHVPGRSLSFPRREDLLNMKAGRRRADADRMADRQLCERGFSLFEGWLGVWKGGGRHTTLGLVFTRPSLNGLSGKMLLA